MKSAQELWTLLNEADDLPYGAAQIAVVEQIMRHVDNAGDPELAFAVRMFATSAYVYGGEPGKAFVPFSWCIADFDRNPQPYHQRFQHNLLWLFKAMVNALTNFPEVPLARTYAVLDDMERRYRESGNGLQAVFKHRYLVASHVGHEEEADSWFERWQSAPRDALSDCAGCDPTDVAHHLAVRGRFADAVEHADPVLAGRLNCTEQPQRILAELMVPYLEVGRPEDAAAAHRRSYRLERGNLADLDDIGAHVEFCARTGNEPRGLEILQRHLDWLEKAPSPAAAMDFAAAGSLLLRRLTEQGHGDVRITRAELGETTAATLADELATRATELAARFDARNGTDKQSRRVAETLAADPREADLSLSPTARPAVSNASPVKPVKVAAVAPVPEVGAAELLDLAKEHYEKDRRADLEATLAAFDRRFPAPDDPLLLARRRVQAGNLLRMAGEDGIVELWTEAAELFETAGAEGEASPIRARVALEKAYSDEYDEAPIRADVAYQEAKGGSAERAAAWARLSILHLLRDENEEADETGDRSDAYAAESGDARVIAMHASLRARRRAAADRPAEAKAAAAEAWEYFREHGPASRLAEVAALYGHLLDDEPERQIEMFGAAIESGVGEQQLGARVGRGHTLVRLGRAAEAIPDLAEAVALCAEAELVDGGAFARFELAEAYANADRPIEAAEVAEEALRTFVDLGVDGPADNCRFLLAKLYREIGDTPGAVGQYRDLIERLADNPAGRAQVGEEAAGLLFDLDRDAEAAEAYRAAAGDLHEAGDLIGELRALRGRVAALHYADDAPAAEEAFRLAGERFAALPAELAEEPNAIWQNGLTAFEFGRVVMSRGRFAEALPALRDVPARLHAIGADQDADRVTGMYGEALLRSGQAAEAVELYADLLGRMAPDAPGRDVAEKVYEEARSAIKDEQ